LLTPDPERIHFNLDEPMSVARPAEKSIRIVGYVQLPITWDEDEGDRTNPTQIAE
jgi:hypothetical protein